MSFKKTVVIVNDKMQKNYRYTLSEPIGKNFDPRFEPELTPKQMLTMGVFGGRYLRDSSMNFLRIGLRKQDYFLLGYVDTIKI